MSALGVVGSQITMLIGHVAVLRMQMWPIVTERVAWTYRSVRWSVCWSVTIVSPAKTAEPIAMPLRGYWLAQRTMY